MKNKDTNIIVRVNSDLKEEVQEIAKKCGFSLSALINAYLMDTRKRGFVPINIRSTAGRIALTKKKTLTFEQIKKAVEKALSNNFLKGKFEKVYLFGSYARGDATPDSDIDLRIEHNDNISYAEVFEFEDLLKQDLGVDVDTVTLPKNELSPAFLEQINKDEMCIYAK